MEARPPLLAHRRQRPYRPTFTPPPGGRRRPAPLHTPAAASRPERPESHSGPVPCCHRPTRAQRPLWLNRRKLPEQPSRLALAAAQARFPRGACAQGPAAAPGAGDVACGGGAQAGGGRVGEEERGERGRQSGERKVREARSGSETRESVRHCGPKKRRARGEDGRASGRDGPLPPTPERKALFLASRRAAAAAAAGTVYSAEGGFQLL